MLLTFFPFFALFVKFWNVPMRKCAIDKNTSCFNKRKDIRSRKTWTMPFHLLGVNFPSQTASHELLPSFQVYHLNRKSSCEIIGKLIGPKQSYVTSHYLPTWWTFIMTSMRISAPPAPDQQGTVICEWHGRNPLTHSILSLQPSGVFFTDGESWAHHQGPQWPCSELSHSCLNGILIVSCFCVVVVFFFFFFLVFWSVSSLHLRGCLSWHLPHHCQAKSDFFLTNHHGKGDIWNRQRRWAKRHRWESLCGKQESGEVNAPSGHFTSIHQLPGCTPKIGKPYFSLCLAPGRPYPCTITSLCLWRPVCTRQYTEVPLLLRGLVSIYHFVGIVWKLNSTLKEQSHKYRHLLSCWKLDEKVDSTLMVFRHVFKVPLYLKMCFAYCYLIWMFELHCVEWCRVWH